MAKLIKKDKYIHSRIFFEQAGVKWMDMQVVQLNRNKTSTNNPKWREQVFNHQNATTPLSGNFDSLLKEIPGWSDSKSQGNNTDHATHKGPMATYKSNGAGNPLGTATISATKAHEKAVSRFLKQIHQAQSQMSGLVFLGELKEAMHMLRHPAEALRRALKESYLDKLKRIKDRDPKRWQKAIAQTWLEGTFGWRPFVNDLEDAAKAYNEATAKVREAYKPLRAIGKDNQMVVGPLDKYRELAAIPGSNVRFDYNQRTWDDAVCVIRGEVKSQANTTLMDKLRIFGLTPEEFIPTVWELLPWSFLVDYFTNIGDILENSVTSTASLAWASESTISTRRREAYEAVNPRRTAEVQGPDIFVSCKGSPSYAKWERRSVVRSPGADLSVPPISFELPGNPIQQLNITALWTQAYYGLHPQKSFRR